MVKLFLVAVSFGAVVGLNAPYSFGFISQGITHYRQRELRLNNETDQL